MSWTEAFASAGYTIASRADLRALGATDRMLTSAARSHHLLRVRRDHYAIPGTDLHVLRAVRVGGRLACVSALRHEGIFGFDYTNTHIHLRKSASRSRSPRTRAVPLTAVNREGARLHWHPLIDEHDGNGFTVGVVDALAQVVRCNHPWHAIASLDNALFLGKINEDDLATLFGHLPDRFGALRFQVDGRSEAGQETVLRCAFRAVGLDPELQVDVPGIGRVDQVLEGRLIVEADSRQAHDGWELHVRDRDRDIDAARLGYMSLRPAYNRTMHATNDVVEAVVHLLRGMDRFRTIL